MGVLLDGSNRRRDGCDGRDGRDGSRDGEGGTPFLRLLIVARVAGQRRGAIGPSAFRAQAILGKDYAERLGLGAGGGEDPRGTNGPVHGWWKPEESSSAGRHASGRGRVNQLSKERGPSRRQKGCPRRRIRIHGMARPIRNTSRRCRRRCRTRLYIWCGALQGQELRKASYHVHRNYYVAHPYIHTNT